MTQTPKLNQKIKQMAIVLVSHNQHPAINIIARPAPMMRPNARPTIMAAPISPWLDWLTSYLLHPFHCIPPGQGLAPWMRFASITTATKLPATIAVLIPVRLSPVDDAIAPVAETDIVVFFLFSVISFLNWLKSLHSGASPSETVAFQWLYAPMRFLGKSIRD